MAANKDTRRDLSKFGFAKTFVLPSLLVFLVPVLSFFFFRHAEKRYNDQAREAILKDIQADRSLSAEKRSKAIEFFTAVPISELAKHDETAGMFAGRTSFDLAVFRWAIRLSALSILGGVAVFVFAGVCVLLSLHSQLVQYLTLSAGWHVLRIYGALQVVVQGALLVALSFWVTALWFKIYSVKLIVIVAVLALTAVVLVIRGIFKRLDDRFEVEGTVLAPEIAGPLWDQLRSLCVKIGTNPPDQIVAGIDDNFFVTEQPVTIDGKTLHGRTLYVSLTLLKQLNGHEADAVLAHEMAHFSGGDTVYSGKISPLLIRYGNYLEMLRQGPVTLPVFQFMLCFRALFELSLRRLGRQREFRADGIAAETVSSEAFAGGLLRIIAYSKYRQQVEQSLFEHERALETADIGARVECGFPAYAASFALKPELGSEEVPHPFDTHPPLAQRLDAVGASLGSSGTSSLLAEPGDGHWYRNIKDADHIERRQWDQFETRFREFHTKMLPYRFLPKTDEERAIVVAAFPELSFAGKDAKLTMDHEKMQHSSWPGPLLFAEIVNLLLSDKGVLSVQFEGGGKRGRDIKMKDFGKSQQQILDAINQYYSRYRMAVEYQKQKQTGAKPT
jgi:Zn-dependent protease with chaperone function